MGRKPKYATLSVYQPYIDIICEDLSLPSLHTLNVSVVFCNASVYQYGDAIYRPSWNEGKVRIYKALSKAETLRTLMHELKHIQQFFQRRLIHKTIIDVKNGRVKSNVLFDGIPGKIIRGALSGKRLKKYLDSPWEIDARAYEKELYRLFPGLKLPETREYIGNVNGTKFYRVKKGYE